MFFIFPKGELNFTSSFIFAMAEGKDGIVPINISPVNHQSINYQKP